VVAEPDEDLGERVHAFVELERPVDVAELLEWVGARLVRYKVPRRITIVDGPLRDEAGKVRRSLLAAGLVSPSPERAVPPPPG
jgi:bile acid-coenzyme A ligase